MRSFVSKALLGATILVGTPTLVFSAAAPASAASHHAHKSKAGPIKDGDAATDDLNAKSLAAAQQDKVPSVGTGSTGMMPSMPGVPTVGMPTMKAPTVTAPTVSVPAAGTGLVAPAAPATPTTTVPANAPTGN
ncbi:hypothetical protein [Acetobacter fallax]|uniref:hypothetical protein n=1 Tax=Acetobacter fallax TaxID=1737473 RepID=UPI00156A8DD9|nr:hypothetical protein [Acetobacter fallax]